MSNETLKESVVKDVRACLVSSGTGLSPSRLEADYRNIIGRRIPYDTLGYSSLLQFLRSVNEFKVSERFGSLHVEAVANAESSHISELVRKQKKPKSRCKGGYSYSIPKRPFNYNYRPVLKPYIPRFNNYSSNQLPTAKPSSVKSHAFPGNKSAEAPSQLPKFTFPGGQSAAPASEPPKPNPTVQAKPVNPVKANVSESKVTFPGTKPAAPPSQPPKSNLAVQPKPSVNNPAKENHSKATFPGTKPAAPPSQPPKSNLAVQPKPSVNNPAKENHSKAAFPGVKHAAPPSQPPKPNPSVQAKQSENSNRTEDSVIQAVINEVVRQSSVGSCQTAPARVSRKVTVSTNNVHSSAQNNSVEQLSEGKTTQENVPKVPPPTQKPQLPPPTQNIKPLTTRNFIPQLPLPTQNLKPLTTCNFIPQLPLAPYIPPFIFNSSIPAIPSYSFVNVRPSLPKPSSKPPTSTSRSQFKSYRPPSYSLKPQSAQNRLDKVRQPQENSTPYRPVEQPNDHATRRINLPLLEKPPSNHWNLFLLNFVNLSRISLRLIGPEYSDAFGELEKEMTERYIQNNNTAHKVLAKELIIGSPYVFVDLNHKFVSRVLLQRYFKEDNRVSVVFFDLADEAVVSADKIYEIDDEFTKLAPQSFEVDLEGLEPYKFAPFKGIDLLTSQYCQKTYVGIVSESDDPCETQLTIYDSSIKPNLNINQAIRNKVASLFEEKAVLKGSFNAFITNIDDSGNVYMNVATKTYDCLLERLNDIDTDQNLKINMVASLEDIVENQYYFVSGESPQRALLSSYISDNSVLMDFVDCGQQRIVEVDKLFTVPCFDQVFSDLPHQAVKVRLSGVDYSWAPRHQCIFIEIVPIFSPVNVIVDSVVNDFPYVTIMLKKDGRVINVGEAMNEILQETKENVMHEDLRQFRFAQPNLQTKTYLPVFVLHCENAENISLQFTEDVLEFRKMIDNLRSHYSENNQIRPFSEWKVHDPCVVLDYDSSFYFRGIILQLINGGYARVYYVDVGYIKFVKIDSVYILHENFMGVHKLSVNAKLAGIKILPGERFEEATSLLNSFFREPKKFCVKVLDIDDSDSFFPTYSVVLYDTSTKEDINFGDLLVQRGLAERIALI